MRQQGDEAATVGDASCFRGPRPRRLWPSVLLCEEAAISWCQQTPACTHALIMQAFQLIEVGARLSTEASNRRLHHPIARGRCRHIQQTCVPLCKLYHLWSLTPPCVECLGRCGMLGKLLEAIARVNEVIYRAARQGHGTAKGMAALAHATKPSPNP
jgi:hypothetical protein